MKHQAIKNMTPPGEGLKTEKMPGHWVLARLGKRVLRPGGLELTHRMLESLDIKPPDNVVEFAPGMGVTARLTLSLGPASYTAVERDEAAARIVSAYLEGGQRCVVGSAVDTGLMEGAASVVYGEAMLTMQTEKTKRLIVREAHRLLRKGGRYGIHEMCLLPDELGEEIKKQIEKALTGVVHHGVIPLTVAEWRALLESEGFEVQSVINAPMSLLEPGRLIRDEGIHGALRFVWNVLRDAEARERVMKMRSVFRRYREHMAAVTITSVRT